MSTSQPNRSGTIRLLLAAIAFLVGIIAGLVGGILQRLAGSSLPQTVEYGCGVFAATVVLTFTVFQFLDWPGDGDA